MTEDSSESQITESTEVQEDFVLPKKNSFLKVLSYAFASLAIISTVLFSVFLYVQQPPTNFPVVTPLIIEKGLSLKEIISKVKSEGFIRSELALYLEILLHYQNKPIQASTYIFETPLTVSQLANELTQGGKRSDLIRFTHYEGETAEQLSIRAAEILKDFDQERFLDLAKQNEGRLFPETYLIPADFKAEDLFYLLRNTFDEQISTLNEKIQSSTLSLEEIIILASIIEREANTPESKKMVSGILQNRLRIGMALQVDASMGYVLDKPLNELTAADLEIDSPYNTYLYPGLPPTAISNPGMDSLVAALEPMHSEYLFYITGNDGNFYYSETFDEHRRNIAKYLR